MKKDKASTSFTFVETLKNALASKHRHLGITKNLLKQCKDATHLYNDIKLQSQGHASSLMKIARSIKSIKKRNRKFIKRVKRTLPNTR